MAGSTNLYLEPILKEYVGGLGSAIDNIETALDPIPEKINQQLDKLTELSELISASSEVSIVTGEDYKFSLIKENWNSKDINYAGLIVGSYKFNASGSVKVKLKGTASSTAPTTSSNIYLYLQYSIDGSNWANVFAITGINAAAKQVDMTGIVNVTKGDRIQFRFNGNGWGTSVHGYVTCTKEDFTFSYNFFNPLNSIIEIQ